MTAATRDPCEWSANLFSRVASSTDERIIAPGNLEVIDDESRVTRHMFPLAGKYFKRFDRESCRFISNIDEEYPRLTV